VNSLLLKPLFFFQFPFEYDGINYDFFIASVLQCPTEFFFSNSPFRYVGINYDLHYQCDVVSTIFFFLADPPMAI
jgi:hypothetical protein